MTTLHSSRLSRIAGVRHAFQSPDQPLPDDLVRCKQVHGARLLDIAQEPLEELRTIEADGLVTTTERPIGIQTADCIPALFASRDGLIVAAVHAGWRGTLKGILINAVERIVREGVDPKNIIASLGPSIGPCCFEVGREVIVEFEKAWGHLWAPTGQSPLSDVQARSRTQARDQAPTGQDGGWLDLRLVAQLQLAGRGLTDVDLTGECTYCGPGRLASYRRGTHLKLPSERQWSWISKSLPN